MPTDPTHGEVHYPDLPMLGTLLVANLRTGPLRRQLRARGSQLVVYEDKGPTDVATGMAGRTGSQMVYQNRKRARPRAARPRRLGQGAPAVADTAHRRAAGRQRQRSCSP